MSDATAEHSPAWWQAVAFGLVGRELPAPPPGSPEAAQPPDAAPIAIWLARHGVTATTIAAERTRCLARRVPWPHLPPDDLRLGIEAAQWDSLIKDVRHRALDEPITVVRRPRIGPPSIDDQRLLAERPPHHG